MEVASTIAEMRAIRRVMGRAKRGLGDVGFVPTLGYLHDGHLSLVRAAKEQNEHTVVSIFVNPTQFNNPGDFERYPRDNEGDLAKLREQGVDAVFMPSAEEMYPAGQSTSVDVGEVTERLEGEHRPGHFRGVATVVTKLFQIVQPQRAYFGRKDAQQLAVIRRLARDLHFDIEIVAIPTVREPDGLAMSSRNTLLSADDKQAALVLSRALRRTEELFAAGERDGDGKYTKGSIFGLVEERLEAFHHELQEHQHTGTGTDATAPPVRGPVPPPPGMPPKRLANGIPATFVPCEPVPPVPC